MLRIGRVVSGGPAYRITCKTYQGLPVLIEHADLMVPALHPHINRPPFHLLAWSVLPDHFHVLIDPCGQSLSDVVDVFKFTFGWFFRVRTGHRGPVWEPGFQKEPVENGLALLEVISDIETDAVQHGIVSDALLHQYSSLHERTPGDGDQCVTPELRKSSSAI